MVHYASHCGNRVLSFQPFNRVPCRRRVHRHFGYFLMEKSVPFTVSLALVFNPAEHRHFEIAHFGISDRQLGCKFHAHSFRQTSPPLHPEPQTQRLLCKAFRRIPSVLQISPELLSRLEVLRVFSETEFEVAHLLLVRFPRVELQERLGRGGEFTKGLQFAGEISGLCVGLTPHETGKTVDYRVLHMQTSIKTKSYLDL